MTDTESLYDVKQTINRLSAAISCYKVRVLGLEAKIEALEGELKASLSDPQTAPAYSPIAGVKPSSGRG